MSTTLLVVGIVVVVVLFAAGSVALILRREFREDGAPPQASGDWCCVCLRDLDVGEVWEVRQHMEATGEELPGGGSWVASTYCPEHAPEDAEAA